MKQFCFQSPGRDFSWKPLSGRKKKKITSCVCLYVIFLLDLDLYKQRHCDSHHICVKGMGQPCSSGLWQTGIWDDPGAGRYLQYRPLHTRWARWEITALIANCRSREHGGAPCAKEVQRKCRRRPRVGSPHPAHVLSLPLLLDRERGVENATGGGWHVFLLKAHSPLQH